MSVVITRSDLRARIQQCADVELETDRFPVANVNTWINASLRRFHTFMVSCRGSDFYEKFWYVQAALGAAGTTPPAVTVTGAPNAPTYNLQAVVTTGGALGTALFKYSLDGGVTFPLTLQPTAATYDVPETGLTLNFAAGTYATNNVYTSNGAALFSTANGQNSYALPPDFLELCEVALLIGGQRAQLRKYNKNERPWLLNIVPWGMVPNVPRYRLRGDARYAGGATIDFAPIPSGVYQLELVYVPTAAQFYNDSGVGGQLNLELLGDEFIIQDVAIHVREKDDLPRQDLIAKMEQIKEEIRTQCIGRDNNAPDRVRDVSMEDHFIYGYASDH